MTVVTVRRRIFVSCPRQDLLPEGPLRDLRTQVLTLLKQAGYEPQEFNESGLPLEETLEWTFENCARVMSRCRGAVILALPRWPVTEGNQEVHFTSEYMHIEGAIALSAGLPTLVVTTREVVKRGVVEPGRVGRMMAIAPRGFDRAWVRSEPFLNHFAAWRKQVEQRKDVFFGYCWAARDTANRIILYLRNLGVTVHDWATDFRQADSILRQIKVSARCAGGIFLFTKDDELAGGKRAGIKAAAPRDNVVFEAGYFVGTKGKGRTLIIRERGAKMPADLGGDIYVNLENRDNTAAIETNLRRFVEDNL